MPVLMLMPRASQTLVRLAKKTLIRRSLSLIQPRQNLRELRPVHPHSQTLELVEDVQDVEQL